MRRNRSNPTVRSKRSRNEEDGLCHQPKANFPVVIAKGPHLFPFRTQQLSPSTPMILGGRPPGKVGRCRSLFLVTGEFLSCDFYFKEKKNPHCFATQILFFIDSLNKSDESRNLVWVGLCRPALWDLCNFPSCGRHSRTRPSISKWCGRHGRTHP